MDVKEILSQKSNYGSAANPHRTKGLEEGLINYNASHPTTREEMQAIIASHKARIQKKGE